ncbi:hypothetical protein [Sphingobium lignivorans]|uniref:Lipoprotein n=1 Tax=Sphingobium lignivorans TaxID=2735886 RepID=A0ABR6NAU7_9SPHN|nr:hypothetical protein [Sphingobium lignivorans]MBB5984406.1 hypothetical protein [Sphingobium lignivorans]
MTSMAVHFRSLCLCGGLALLAACGGQKEADNLAELDARLTNGSDALSDDASDAIAIAEAGGKIEKAPPAKETGETPGRATIGGLVRRGDGAGAAPAPGGCASDLKSGSEWAERMPRPFRLYPGARLTEAAGIDREQCRLRVVSFATDAGIDQIMDYYYTQARRAGYDAEHLLSQGEHQLGGTREKDGAAYVVFARAGKDGQTDVDVIANAE